MDIIPRVKDSQTSIILKETLNISGNFRFKEATVK
jgi:hypothetical protein